MSDALSDEELHPGHHSIRLKDHDYAGGGFYFVTICAHEKKGVFGRIVTGLMQPSPLGQIVRECWMGISEHFPGVRLHGFVVMPNHLHGIIEIGCQMGRPPAAGAAAVRSQGKMQNRGEVDCSDRADMGRSSAAPLRVPQSRVVAGSLGAVVRSFKAAVTKRAGQELGREGEVWRRNYFERALRDGKEHADARRYIDENILKWELDLENPERKKR